MTHKPDNRAVTSILVVDDELLLSYVLSGYFRKAGFEVVSTARNGKEALARTHELAPDVVTMDVRMPEMDGLEATRRIMLECPTCVIVLTAFRGSQPEAEAAGAMGYAVKPVFAHEVTELVHKAQALYACYGEVRQETASLEAALANWQTVLKALKQIAASANCDNIEAFEKLRTRAKQKNVTLLEAAQVVLDKQE
jgi:two-component system, response regulator PdtaR